MSEVPEPDNLLVIARVSKPESIVKAVGSWTHLPLPGAKEVASSMIEGGFGEVIDFSQPIDGAVSLVKKRREPEPVAAVSVTIPSVDAAKEKLAKGHRVTTDEHGLVFIEVSPPSDEGSDEEGEAPSRDRKPVCVLAPAANQASRMVCGSNRQALDELTPYLTRTAPRRTYSSDVHVELRVAPLRAPLAELRLGLPHLARGLFSSSPAAGELLEAVVNEMMDVVTDAKGAVVDAKLDDSGVVATTVVTYAGSTSLMSKLASVQADKAAAPPAAFWHLPSGTDLAAFSGPSDPKLFDHPKELLAKGFVELANAGQMPDGEKRAIQSLILDRILPLTLGPLVYGKGYDMAALQKAVAARKGQSGDRAALEKAEREIATEMLGWQLVQVGEPISKVGPIFKDIVQLWQRPSFAGWIKKQAATKQPVARMRIAPNPAGVKLPTGTIHLEVTVPLPDLEEWPPSKPGATKQPGPKKIPRKPIVLHLLAVPDVGNTWLGFGLDDKLVARKAAEALSTAPASDPFGQQPQLAALRDAKLNGALAVTPRGVLVVSAVDHGRTPFAALGSLPHKGETPIVMTYAAQPATSAGATAVSTMTLPRPVIEDIVRLIMLK